METNSSSVNNELNLPYPSLLDHGYMSFSKLSDSSISRSMDERVPLYSGEKNCSKQQFLDGINQPNKFDYGLSEEKYDSTDLTHTISSGSYSSSSSNRELNSDEDTEAEWCEAETLGMKVVKRDQILYITIRSKAYVCDFQNHTIEVYKGNKCFYTISEKCFIRYCYDIIRTQFGIVTKKDIAYVIFIGIYDYQHFENHFDSASEAILYVHQSYIDNHFQFRLDKDYKNILQKVYNLSRFDSFKLDYDNVVQWMNDNLNICDPKRAFDLVYCAYYCDGYYYGSVTDNGDHVYRYIIDEIRNNMKDSKKPTKLPSPTSVQYGIGIKNLPSWMCLLSIVVLFRSFPCLTRIEN